MSPPDEDADEGGTARMVGLGRGDGGDGGGGVASSTFSRPGSLYHESGGGEDAGVLPWEKRLEDGEKEEATNVSASEVLVDVECR